MPQVDKAWNGLQIKSDNLKSFLKAMDHLTNNKLYVGVPDSTATRTPDPDDEPGEETNNAQIAYIQNYGSPAHNIPARPFMTLGVKDVQEETVRRLGILGKIALQGDVDGVDKGLIALGLFVSAAVQNRLRAGPWIPLSPKTVEARMRRRKKNTVLDASSTAKQSLKYSKDYAANSKPLIDTARLIKAITFVIRRK